MEAIQYGQRHLLRAECAARNGARFALVSHAASTVSLKPIALVTATSVVAMSKKRPIQAFSLDSGGFCYFGNALRLSKVTQGNQQNARLFLIVQRRFEVFSSKFRVLPKPMNDGFIMRDACFVFHCLCVFFATAAPNVSASRDSRLDVIWVQWSKPSETAKIRHVQREDMAHAMNIPCRCQARIMNLVKPTPNAAWVWE
jgi:hypothetical protein